MHTCTYTQTYVIGLHKLPVPVLCQLASPVSRSLCQLKPILGYIHVALQLSGLVDAKPPKKSFLTSRAAPVN